MAVFFVVTAGSLAAAQDRAATSAVERSAQQRDPYLRSRPQTRLRVTPRYPRRTFNYPYPLPYDIEYPGPNAFRHCDFRLAQEYRPSGTVIVPRQRCYWVHRR